MMAIWYFSFLPVLFAIVIGSNENCGNESIGPVAQGIDFVDLLTAYYQNNGTLQSPQQGLNEYAVKFNDYSFWFFNASNAALFETNPSKYAPKYGCFCSWTLTGNDPYCANVNANSSQPWCIGPLCTWTTNGYAVINDDVKGDFNYHPSAKANIQSADGNWAQFIKQQGRMSNGCFNTQYFNNNTECLSSIEFI